MTATVPTEDVSQLLLGTAPDSWGVWFPEDPTRSAGRQYLDEVANAGYVWTELGPQGFLPQDPAQLRDELDIARPEGLRRNRFRRSAQGQGRRWTRRSPSSAGRPSCCARSARNTWSTCPSSTPTCTPARPPQSGDLDPERWSNLVSGTNELGKVIFEEFGVELVFHPHADTHVDTQDRILRFLEETDPQLRQPVPGHRARRLLRRGQPRRSSNRPRSGSPTCT